MAAKAKLGKRRSRFHLTDGGPRKELRQESHLIRPTVPPKRQRTCPPLLTKAKDDIAATKRLEMQLLNRDEVSPYLPISYIWCGGHATAYPRYGDMPLTNDIEVNVPDPTF